MAFGFVFYRKARTLAAGKLFGAGLLGIEMIETRFAGDHFAPFCQLEPFRIRFVRFHFDLSIVTDKPFGFLLY